MQKILKMGMFLAVGTWFLRAADDPRLAPDVPDFADVPVPVGVATGSGPLEGLENKRLETLSNDDLQCGLGATFPNHIGCMIGDLHHRGDTWEKDRLETFFKGGLLREYVRRNASFDPDFSYNLDSSIAESLGSEKGRIMRLLLTRFDKKDIQGDGRKYGEILKKIVDIYMRAFEILSAHPILLKLGRDYHRGKIKLEKWREYFNKEPDVWGYDAINTDTITAIYHWVDGFFEVVRGRVAELDVSAITAENPIIFDGLEDWQPNFMTWPIYVKLMDDAIHPKILPPASRLPDPRIIPPRHIRK